jgi:hypothetical protein
MTGSLPLGPTDAAVEAGFLGSRTGRRRDRLRRMRIPLPLELSPERKQALRAVVGHCTVHNTLRQPPEVTVELG